MKSHLNAAGLALAAGLLLAGPASAQDVTIDFDPAVDFANYKTFALKLGTAWGNPLGEKRVVDEITAGLVEKGWKAAPEETADTVVVLHGATSTKKSLNTFYSGGYGGYYWGGMGGTSTTSVNEYTVGTLVTDIFDARSKKLIWRGTAQDELSEKPEKNKKKLAKASDKLFKNFPPGSADKKK
jgi:hypothetical protein